VLFSFVYATAVTHVLLAARSVDAKLKLVVVMLHERQLL